MFGNDKFFKPRWTYKNALSDPDYFDPTKWTYMYDHSPLVKTLEKYIDYDKLQPGGNPNTRLILTAVNILTAEPLTFDSSKQQITPKHILATSSYPLYNFQWIEVEEGVYAWDGSLLSNTPLREVLEASPIKNKRILHVIKQCLLIWYFFIIYFGQVRDFYTQFTYKSKFALPKLIIFRIIKFKFF